MAEFYHSTTCEIDAETGVDVHWNESGKQFHIWIGNGLSRVTVMLDDKQLDRLAEKLRHAQYEQDIRTGRFVPDDGDGLVPGGKPVNATPEKCDGCGKKFGQSPMWVECGQSRLCLGCDNDDRVTVGKPVSAGQEKCDGCGSKFAPSSARVKHGQYVLCLGCNADDRVTVGKQAKTAG